MNRLGNFVIKSGRNAYKSDICTRSLASAAAQRKSTSVDPQDDKNRPNYSFVSNIFRGQVESKEMFPYPDVLSAEQKEFTNSLVDPFENFFSNVNNSVKNEENCQIEQSTLDHMWELGCFGLQPEEEYGGLGLNNTQNARMAQIVGAHDLGVGVTLGAHQSIGYKGIFLYGTPEQKQKYLPKVTTGRTFAAFCLTEPSSGSDAASIKASAKLSDDGKHYILNGSKIWISNGGICDIMTVFARTSEKHLTAFIVERGFGGVTSGPPENKMGIKCSNTTEVFYEDVKIPVENVLGEVGDGFKVAMNILNNGRYGMGATLSGTMKACIEKAVNHANNRLQFGNKIKEYGAIQEKIARMTMLQYVTESMSFQIAQNMDSGSLDYHLEAAISKVFSSESAWYVCDEAIQVLGGMGYMKDTGLEKVLRDIRIFRIFEGSNDILRLFVALTGIQYAGANLKELQKALKNPASNLGFLSQEVSRRAMKQIGIGGCNLGTFVAPALKSQADSISQCIDLFGKTVESLLVKYNKNIIHEQFLLNCLANSAIDIYGSVVCLSRASRAVELNLPTAEHEVSLTKAWCTEASVKIVDNLTRTSSRNYQEIFREMKNISKTVCDNEGVNTTHIV
ncbi:ACADVL.2 family protein [Megaselia abdita]